MLSMCWLQVTQLRELLEVRWSVFVLGPAGCGKSSVWRTLAKAQSAAGEKTVVKALNPKSVTRNELYGYLHPSTREWKEGLISVTFRDMANTAGVPHQWIVFDGDIDAEWIESMNTVMDDNKMLTLASNERIPLTPSMRLLFEVRGNGTPPCSAQFCIG
jgi:dynein heavy chain